MILQELMNGNSIDAKAVQLELKSQYKVDFQVESINNALEVLEGKFVSKKEELQKYSHIEILQESKKVFMRECQVSQNGFSIIIFISILLIW